MVTTSATEGHIGNPERRTRPRTLPRRVRQGVLVLHILSAGIWVGVDVVVAVLVLAGRFAGSADTRSLAGEALASFVLWPMLTTGIMCLLTGVVLGLGTKWGLVRYRWVAVKLVVNVVLCLAIVFALAPSLDEVASAPGAMPDDMFFPPAVSLVALSFATTLAVMKPWGRIRPRPSAAVAVSRPR